RLTMVWPSRRHVTFFSNRPRALNHYNSHSQPVPAPAPAPAPATCTCNLQPATCNLQAIQYFSLRGNRLRRPLLNSPLDQANRQR
ncbi:hypothetical protein, partial [Burkholderia pseudomallei]|uniref:hypothetical protein n=1 Tax=Burkholderia pseudomallei TaxID=28450 RepID=UPI001C4C4255